MMVTSEERINQRKARKKSPEVIRVISPVVTNGFVRRPQADDNLLSLFYNLPGELDVLAIKVMRQDMEELNCSLLISLVEHAKEEVRSLDKTLREEFNLLRLDKPITAQTTLDIFLRGIIPTKKDDPNGFDLLIWTSALFYPHSSVCRKERG